MAQNQGISFSMLWDREKVYSMWEREKKERYIGMKQSVVDWTDDLFPHRLALTVMIFTQEIILLLH